MYMFTYVICIHNTYNRVFYTWKSLGYMQHDVIDIIANKHVESDDRISTDGTYR